MFELHPRLEADTITVGEFELCQLLIHKDANYPWFIMVPKRPELLEIYHLSEEERIQLMKESCMLVRQSRLSSLKLI